MFNFVHPSTILSKELKMGFFLNSPHVIRIESKQPVGAIVDWFNQYIAPQINADIIWETMGKTVPRLLLDLKAGRTDMVVLLAKSSDREEWIHYPKKPFLVASCGILVKKEFRLDAIHSFEEIKKDRLGFSVGGFIPKPIKKANLNFDLIVGDKRQEQNIKKLMLGRLEGMFDPQDLVLHYYAEQFEIVNQTKVIKLPVKPVANYTVFSKTSTESDLVEQYEIALQNAISYCPIYSF